MFAHENEVIDANEADEDANTAARGTLKVGDYDVTPYERVHAGYTARFQDGYVPPHKEVGHEDHGLQGRSLDRASLELMPTYDDLLWYYQHGGYHHGDAEGEVHHEDVAVDESDPLDDDVNFEYHQHQAFDPSVADKEYVLYHGDLHPADHQYHHDYEDHTDWRGESEIYADQWHYRDLDHHSPKPFWREQHGGHNHHSEAVEHGAPLDGSHTQFDYNHDVGEHHGK